MPESTVRILLDILIIETALLVAVLAGVSVFLFRRPSKTGQGQAGSRPSANERTGKVHRQLEELVQKTNERNNYINSIFSSIGDGFILVDSQNRIVLYNPKAMELLGLGPSVFFDDQATDILSSHPLAPILATCRKVTDDRQPEQLLLQTADGRTLDVRISPVSDKYRNASGLGSLAVAKDVTELRKLENLKKEFVANVSHEFRTPLTLISGFTEMFEMSKNISEADRKRALEIITIETERLKRLVSELLTLSEIEHNLPGETAPLFDVASSLEAVVFSLESIAVKKHQRLSSDIRLADRRLRGNENWFYLAVKNIVENAIKYTQAGGSILVSGWQDGQRIAVSVADDGIGIAEDELERIFERFYRVEKARGSGSGGSGLGLALVQDIVSLFGGSVLVESTPGKGSVFTMFFPFGTDVLQGVLQ